MKRLSSAVVACLLIATGAYAQHDHATMSHADHAPADHDRMFADAMSQHHQDGIKMADLASRKAESAELRAMAQKMITDQRHEISNLQRFRGDGTMTPMEKVMEMPGMMSGAEMKRDMERLEAASGREFDAIFTEVMPRHHQGAITMSEHYLEKGSNPAMKELARQIAAKQRAESQQLLAMHEPPAETMASAGASSTSEPSTSADAESTTPEPAPAAPRARLRKD